MIGDASAACGFLFNVPRRVARKLLPKLEPRDVRIAANMIGYRDGDGRSRHCSSREARRAARIRKARNTLFRYICRRRRRERLREMRARAVHTYHRGPIEHRVLRFGSYLYNRGVISREMLDDALDRQQRCRPRMGQIAMRDGILSPREFALIMCFRHQGVMFGESARELRLLGDREVRVLKIAQACYRRPLGSFFIDQGLLDQERLDRYQRDMIKHNVRCAA